MLKLYEVKDWASSSEALPTSGTMQNGILYQLMPLVSLTSDAGFGLLPTPLASDSKGTARGRFYGSRDSRFSRTVEKLRKSSQDGIYPSLNLCEAMMGYPITWTELEP